MEKKPTKIIIHNIGGGSAAFVFGLPRCRTTWFAALINAHQGNSHTPTGEINAYHELGSKVLNAEQYLESLKPYGYGGLAVDCTSQSDGYIEGSKVVVVMRSTEQVVRSLSNLRLFSTVASTELCHAVTVLKDKQNAFVKSMLDNNPKDLLVVHYPTLRFTDTIQNILTHIGIDPDDAIIEEMQELNITAQYLNSMSFEEFQLAGHRLNSMFELHSMRDLIKQQEAGNSGSMN